MKILVIEDEKELAESICIYLTNNQFTCEKAFSVNDAYDKIHSFEYDCILLDLMLKDGDGMNLIHTIRKEEKGEGLIIISAKESIDSKVKGLSLGADDYLTKPFHLPELLARIKALIRRKKFNVQNELIFNELKIDLSSNEAFGKDLKINLTKTEFKLLVLLVGNANRDLSKKAIAEYISGDLADLMSSHDFVYAHMKNLKKKLAESNCNDYIKTIYGIGYKWQP